MEEIKGYVAAAVSLVAVCAGFLTARRQLRAARRATAVTIAKNHYRETLDLFLKHHDIVYLGVKASTYQTLTEHVSQFRRYRWLATITMFSLQELYNVFVSDPEGKDARWERTIVIISSVFRCHLLSEEHFPEYIRSGYDPAFLEFVFANLRKHEHPASSLQISEFTVR